MKISKSFRIGILLMIFSLFSAVFPVTEVHAEDKKEYVLYLGSYSYAWETIPLQIKGVQDALSDRCVINYEFMDTKNVTYGDDYKEFYDILKYKLSQRPEYDGVLVADDAALKFILKYRDELFPDTPIAFTGIDNIESAEEAAKKSNISGVVERVDYAKNIEIAKKLLPDADKIVFINDKKENGIGIQKQLEESSSAFDGYDVTYLVSADYTKEELEIKLRELDDKTIVFMVSLGQGKNGVTYSEDERQDIIAKNISVPVFRVSSTNFPEIFLGGYVVDHEKSAYLAGMMLQNVLDGGNMADEVLVENTPCVYCFNQEKMEQFNLSMSLLPKETTIVYPVPTFLSEHYLPIINLLVLVALLLLIGVVFGLLRHMKAAKESSTIIQRQKDELEKALQAKSEFLSRMSHEMRTPLNSILGCSHLAQINYDKHEDISEDLVMIDHAGVFLLDLINDILDVSKIEAKKIKLEKVWCSPRKVLQSAVTMMIPIMDQKKIHFEYPGVIFNKTENVEWFVDPQRVQQILVNLLNNAAKFTPEGGIIKLSIKNKSHDDKMSVDTVSVIDTGCGMSKEFIAHIGEAFNQEHNQYSDKVVGSGLGLFIVKRIVELMGGFLNVESEIGEGSTFSFDISYEYRIKQEESIDDKVAEEEIHLDGMKVLYAEDNAMNQIVGKRLLEHKGIEVVIVSNGEEAVNAIVGSAIGEYHAVLMDIRMPVMNGIDATIAIRQLERSDVATLPIIALSADAIPSEIAAAKEKGLNDYLTKPINPTEVYRTLEKWRNQSENSKMEVNER